MRKVIIKAVFCLAGAILNVAVGRICIAAGIPLYLDTIFTISVTLTSGLYFGMFCGALTNFLSHTIGGVGWEGYLFILCNVATALVVLFLMRLFPRELNLSAAKNTESIDVKNSALKSNLFGNVMDRVIVLIILSFALCLAMSLLGGFLAVIIISMSNSYGAEGSGITAFFSASMFSLDSPLILTEIVSRIPVNIVDRLISTFSGFLIALGFRRILRP